MISSQQKMELPIITVPPKRCWRYQSWIIKKRDIGHMRSL